MENYILHTGTPQRFDYDPHGSGRFREGSGKNPHQHEDSLKLSVEKLKKQGLTDGEIAKALLGEHAKPGDLKLSVTLEKKRERMANRAKALAIYDEIKDKETGKANISEIARRMFGDPKRESEVRKLLDDTINERQTQYLNTAEMMANRIASVDSKMIDVSSDTELNIGVSLQTKKLAIRELEERGYIYTTVSIKMGNYEKKVKVLADPSMSWVDIQKNKYNVDSIVDFTPDGGITFETVKSPVSIDSKRIYVRYGNDDPSGTDKDGVIELRRNVDDISLNGSTYSQVRIAVDDKGYMKGMAMYSDSVPDGYDVVYNTNKNRGTHLFAEFKGDESVYKPLKEDPDNLFGATIKPITAGGQYNYIGKDGKEHQSVINKVQDEGDWDNWGKTWSAQMVSKQDMPLIKRQIDASILDKKVELEGIRSLTNPVIKQKMLEDFAESCDSNAASLKVRGVKGSQFQVILPVPSLKDNEIYAPNLKPGEQVALIRYPHGGIFEIPVLTVTDKNKEANSVIGKNARDCVGINIKNADKLSGADFDGDTVLVIPLTSTNTKIKYAESLQQLKNFDHKSLYKRPADAEPIKDSTKQKQMGIVTNLITDMTAGGASLSEIAEVVKHSMVVIDCVKHNLDYKQSEKDQHIDYYKRKYQQKETEDGSIKYGGASTIFSRAASKQYVDKRREIADVSKMTDEQKQAYAAGKKVYVDKGDTMRVRKEVKDPSKMTPDELQRYSEGKRVYRDTGKTKMVQEKVKQMYLVDDAMELVRDKTNKKEVAYAEYANTLKSLANRARKEARSMTFESPSPQAKATYREEIESLDRKLRAAMSNNPKERKAQAIMNAVVAEKIKNSSEEIDYEHKQRMRAQELEKARAQLGAKKKLVDITDREWEAIQANAIPQTRLKKILSNTDQDAFKERAMPRNRTSLTASQIILIKQMAKSGQYTNAEIANRLGISPSTVSQTINS